MAAYDFLSSIVFSLGALPLKSVEFNEKQLGAYGNDASCKVTGFVLLLSQMSSLFLNASLSTYYLLVIVKSAQEQRLYTLRTYLIGIPIVCGLILGCAGIPFVATQINVCGLNPPSPLASAETAADTGYATSWAPYLSIFLVPALLVLAYATAVMIRIYVHVTKLRGNSSQFRHRFRRGSTRRLDSTTSIGSSNRSRSVRRIMPRQMSSLQLEVTWQCVFYLFALYTPWCIYIARAIIAMDKLFGNYEMWCAFFFLTQLQPFLNCLVYFRPRLSRKFRQLRAKWRTWRANRREKLQEKEEQQEPPPSSVVDDDCIEEVPAPPPATPDDYMYDGADFDLGGGFWPENTLVLMNERLSQASEGSSTNTKSTDERASTSGATKSTPSQTEVAQHFSNHSETKDSEMPNELSKPMPENDVESRVVCHWDGREVELSSSEIVE